MSRRESRRATPILGREISDLELRREDIRFWNITPELLQLEVTLRNQGRRLTSSTLARIEIAPFGAFLPWTPVTPVPVPRIWAGSEHRLRVQLPLGRGGRPPLELCPPREPGDEHTLPTPGGFQRIGTAHRDRREAPTDGGLRRLIHMISHDLAGMYWSGNVRVLVGGMSMERHLAQAVRIHPGHTNVAMFTVGDGPDAFAFEPRASDPSWTVSVRSLNDSNALPVASWREQQHCTQYMVEMRIPEFATEGTVEVHVRRRSDAALTVVEFSFAVDAKGPSCDLV